ncbi:MAG: 2-amino-4-hydroxy-6-hydroxymethyldihydropteridine diphosphokinase [Alphaproteobacteria bacterium]|nr:2-amino-4-hydroxy-6-hydroxymethyldihydropteridine diphosphokinase [Alphaproteobacteria bacterium]
MILIAFGANLPSRHGPPEQTFEAVKCALASAGVEVAKSSGLWHTAPVPVSSQPWYKNAVVEVKTGLGAFELLELLQRIEKDFGRADAAANAPRCIDLDLLAYNEAVINEDNLALPHPRMQERGFVLYPLAQVAPRWRHPVLQKTVNEMLCALPAGQVAEPLEIAA